MSRQGGWRGLLWAVLVLAGCVAPLRPAAPPPPEEADRRPGVVYELTGSDLAVLAYRDGPLAHLGHNHVIASTGIAGRIIVREPLADSSFEIELPLATLTVDEPERRAAAGPDFPGSLAEEDRAGTLRNLLGPALLSADRFPVIRMTGIAIIERGAGLEVTARVEIAGAVRMLVVPVEIRRDAERLEARGRFTVTHAALGLTPFNVAFGTLRVRDDLNVEFRLTARRAATGS